MMRKSFSILFLFLTFAPVLLAQSITIPGRPVGANTYVSVKIYGTAPMSLRGFELSIVTTVQPGNQPVIINPNKFILGDMLMQSQWTSAHYVGPTMFRVAAVGQPVNLSPTLPEYFCKVVCRVAKNISGAHYFPETIFHDGNQSWLVSNTLFDIIDVPAHRYGDLITEGHITISDAIELFSIINGGQFANDTLAVMGDLDGSGEHDSWDVYLLLRKIVNHDYVFPIFVENYYGYQPQILPLTWKKMADGKWGLYSPEPITNGDLSGQNTAGVSLPIGSNSWFKNENNKITFVGLNSATNNAPVLIASSPVQLTGTVNEGRVIKLMSLTDSENESMAPSTFTLSQNYPNPFNPSTTITYSMASAGQTSLRIFDVLGNEVATLVNEEKPAGQHEVSFTATNIPSGTYFYQLRSGSFSETKKMVILK